MSNETYHPRGKLVHGYRVRKHPLYSVWASMKARCSNSNDPAYMNYGGRGITYCARWRHFENFAMDMWPVPFSGATLERKNNNKGYYPNNCIWATPAQHARNRRVFKNSKTGSTGIIPIPSGFNARYDDRGIRYNLGNFDTIQKAKWVRDKFIHLYKSNNPRAYTMLSRGNSDRRLRRDSSNGIKGISSHKSGFVIRKHINGKRCYLGFAITFDKAIKILQAAS